MIKVKVNFSGKVQEYAGEEMTEIQLPVTADVAQFFQVLTERKPKMLEIVKFLFVSVNNTMAPRTLHLEDGDEISLFFRMGGG
ncbi:MAG: MoaD/ThiS family protein [Anaerolineaceae bacterium]|jgi:molybdopterin converting factor small subunit